MVTKAEGEKQAMILAADGRLESAKRDAVAQVTLAESSARAIQKVAEAMGQQDAPLYYLLGEKYIHGITSLAESPNSKMIVLPADLQESLRGLLGRR
jgi:regulator of protease activity HflC (stomatin/prohibitin superfamily)